MRRARYLAGDDAFSKAKSARYCLCGPAIPTQECAPAWHAGQSTDYCMDPQAILFACYRELSHRRKRSDTIKLRRYTWRRRKRKDARLLLPPAIGASAQSRVEREREIMTGIGPVAVRPPRVRNRETGAGDPERPLYARDPADLRPALEDL